MTTHPSIDETIRTAFADLRAGARPLVQPPGTAAAQHTVRRRRAYAATVAGLATVAVLGGGVAVAAGWQQAPGGTGPAPGLAAGQSAEPTAATDPIDPEALAEVTGTVLANTVGSEARIYAMSQGDPPPPVPALLLSSETGFRPGTYRLAVACGGTGQATVTLSWGGQPVTATATCGATAEEIADGMGRATLEIVNRDFQVEVEEVEATGRPEPEQPRIIAIALEPASGTSG